MTAAGGARWGALAGAAAALGCGGPEMVLGYGALVEDHGAQNVVGCGADERTIREHRGTTTLSAQQRGVSRRLDADGEASAIFAFDVAPEVAGGVGTLTLSAYARVEDERCGTGCEGASAGVRFAWSGAVSLPPAAQGYAVRVAVYAERHSSMGSRLLQGECAVETPWRPPIVVEAGNTVREFDAPAGDATIRVGCDRANNRQLVSIGCYGAPHSSPPREQGFDDWNSARLRVQVRFARRAD